MHSALALTLLLACATSEGDTGTATAPTLSGPCASAERLGGFLVQASAAASGVQGAVADGVVPTTVLVEVERSGDCVVLETANPVCAETCGAGETCGLSGDCVPYPQNQDLGTVTVDGLSAPVSMDPVQPGNSYFDTTLPEPPFAEGQAITLSLGGWAGPQELHGVGSAELVPGEGAWTIDGNDLALSWQAPAGDTPTTVRLELRLDQHGSTPRRLRCTLPDTGAATVPGELLDRLVSSGVSGWPRGELRRHTTDHATLDAGCIDLEVAWVVEVEVEVDGHTPCSSDLDCPEGMECDLELESCV